MFKGWLRDYPAFCLIVFVGISTMFHVGVGMLLLLLTFVYGTSVAGLINFMVRPEFA